MRASTCALRTVLHTTHCILHTAYRVLCTVYCALHTTYYILHTTHYTLSTAHLHTTYCILHITYYRDVASQLAAEAGKDSDAHSADPTESASLHAGGSAAGAAHREGVESYQLSGTAGSVHAHLCACLLSLEDASYRIGGAGDWLAEEGELPVVIGMLRASHGGAMQGAALLWMQVEVVASSE